MAMNSESREQIYFVNWMRKTYPQHRIFHIPNGGHRNKIEAAKLKNEGVSPGVPDLFVPSLRLFIEMKKADGGVISPEQQQWLEYLRHVNYGAEVCYGCDAAKDTIKIYLIKMKK
jgi:hypothetical protein